MVNPLCKACAADSEVSAEHCADLGADEKTNSLQCARRLCIHRAALGTMIDPLERPVDMREIRNQFRNIEHEFTLRETKERAAAELNVAESRVTREKLDTEPVPAMIQSFPLPLAAPTNSSTLWIGDSALTHSRKVSSAIRAMECST